jgi:chromosome segregation ATPase
MPDKNEDKLTRIQSQLDELHSQYEQIIQRLEKHDEILFGGTNVHDGLLTRLKLLETQLKETNESIKDLRVDISVKLNEVERQIKELDKQMRYNNSKTMLYILTTITIINSFIALLISLHI